MKSWGTPTSSAARSKLRARVGRLAAREISAWSARACGRDAQIFHGHLARHDGVQGNVIEGLAALAADFVASGFGQGIVGDGEFGGHDFAPVNFTSMSSGAAPSAVNPVSMA